MDEVGDRIVLWAITAAIHTAILVAVVSALDPVARRAGDGARELAWRVALLGGFVTAALQVGAGVAPVAGTFAPLDASAPAAPLPVPSEDAAEATTAAVPANEWTATLATWAMTLWGAVATLALLHLALGALVLRRRLAPRRPSDDLQRIGDQAARCLGLRGAPRVTVSPRVVTPLALGVLRAEVCVPVRAINELAPAELRAMLAHELAHVARRDPAWALVYAAACRCLFWHPLAWLARRRLLALAELRCDARARATASDAGVALAGALVRAAEWLAQAPRRVAVHHGSAMAATTSGLARRIRLLLAAPAPPPASPAAARLVAIGLGLAAPFVLPGASAPESPPAPVTVSVPLPAPLAALAADLRALRAEVDEIADLVTRAGLAGDATIQEILREVDARLRDLESSCAALVAVQLAQVPVPSPTDR